MTLRFDRARGDLPQKAPMNFGDRSSAARRAGTPAQAAVEPGDPQPTHVRLDRASTAYVDWTGPTVASGVSRVFRLQPYTAPPAAMPAPRIAMLLLRSRCSFGGWIARWVALPACVPARRTFLANRLSSITRARPIARARRTAFDASAVARFASRRIPRSCATREACGPTLDTRRVVWTTKSVVFQLRTASLPAHTAFRGCRRTVRSPSFVVLPAISNPPFTRLQENIELVAH